MISKIKLFPLPRFSFAEEQEKFGKRKTENSIGAIHLYVYTDSEDLPTAAEAIVEANLKYEFWNAPIMPKKRK